MFNITPLPPTPKGYNPSLFYNQPFTFFSSDKNKVCCYFCTKNYSYNSFAHHICTRPRCFNCARFNKRTCSYYAKDKFCLEKKNTDKYCQKCSKTFSSDDCFVYHQKYACKIFSKCKICNKYFRKSTGHQCGFFYCRVCYSFHKSDNKTCFVRPNISFKKNESNYFFLDINLKDEIPLYIALTNIKDFTLLYKYPSSMSKYLEYSVFKEIIYKDTTNVIFEFCKFLFDESKKHKGMTILASDNTIQYLLYFLREFEKFFVNLSNFTIQNITFKNVGLFLNLPHTQIANKIKLNPCLARIPNQINENWSKNELYDFKSEDFCLMSLFGNSQADCEKFINGLQSVSNFVDKKSYYGK